MYEQSIFSDEKITLSRLLHLINPLVNPLGFSFTEQVVIQLHQSLTSEVVNVLKSTSA